MELFKAGNESQLKTICKWIDECDVYMLILGGRYGTLEPKSGKSYTHFEYDYALSKNIPVFAVVLNQDFLTKKIVSIGLDKITEIQSPGKYKNFKEYVMTKIIREVEDCKDIKIAVYTTLNEFLDEYTLTGWIRDDNEYNTNNLLTEIKEISKENRSLMKENQKLKELTSNHNKNLIGEYTYEEIKASLIKHYFDIPYLADSDNTESTIETKSIDALSVFIQYFNCYCTGLNITISSSKTMNYIYKECSPIFITFGLLERVKQSGKLTPRIQTSKLGNKFFSLLKINNEIK